MKRSLFTIFLTLFALTLVGVPSHADDDRVREHDRGADDGGNRRHIDIQVGKVTINKDKHDNDNGSGGHNGGGNGNGRGSSDHGDRGGRH